MAEESDELWVLTHCRCGAKLNTQGKYSYVPCPKENDEEYGFVYHDTTAQFVDKFYGDSFSPNWTVVQNERGKFQAYLGNERYDTEFDDEKTCWLEMDKAYFGNPSIFDAEDAERERRAEEEWAAWEKEKEEKKQ